MFQRTHAQRKVELLPIKEKRTMKENLTNVGKKEQRQINQLLNKEAKEGRRGLKLAEARTVSKQHKLKGRKGK
jgi:hypothetical protein